jgi:hypothetical protein
MNSVVKYTVPSASSFYTTETSSSSSAFSFSTLSETSIYINPINFGEESDEGDKGDNSTNNVKYVCRTKPNAHRIGKKLKGSIEDANNKRLRIKNLLKPIVVFRFLKDRFKKIEQKELSKRLEKVASILESTAITNQIALREKIQEKFGKFIREQEMISCGFDKYFEKEILQAFVDSVKEKAIKITPIKNYIRLIPKNVRDEMEIAKEKKLFDDFVVIHSDPENKAVEKTIEEKKDPILCGVIRESSRYYFIGDWQDELCDLTMDTILTQLGLDESDITLIQEVETALLEIL